MSCYTTVRLMSNYRNISLEGLAGAFKGLSNQKRLELFRHIVVTCCNDACCTADENSVGVDELAAKFGLARSTVSHHLKELRGAGLLRITKRGRFNEFALNCEHVETLLAFLGDCRGGGQDE